MIVIGHSLDGSGHDAITAPCLAPRACLTQPPTRASKSGRQTPLAPGESVIKCPSPLNVLKDAQIIAFIEHAQMKIST
jgi:hypothetical protein